MSNPHDDALREFVPDDLKAEFDRTREQPKPKATKPKQPEKPEEPQRRAAEWAPSYFGEKLIESHATWHMAGQPAEGPEADRLVEALTDAYLVSEDDSPFEQEVVQFAESIGATEVLGEAVEAYNRALEVGETKDAYRAHAFDVFRGMPQGLIDAVGNSFTPEFLEQVRDGEIEPEELRRELAARVETARELHVTDQRRTDLEQLDDALLREGPKDEKGMAEYREVLAKHTEENTRFDREAVAERAAIRAGDKQPPPDPVAQAEQEELRRSGLLPGEAQERQDRWRREAAAEAPESVDA